MVGEFATIHNSKKIELDIARINANHLEFDVREHHGKYAVTEHLADGTTIWYTGFPTRAAAERFVLAQPESWE